MNAIREMGYIAVGVGKTEFAIEIDKVLGEYALQKQQPPYLLAGNLTGAERKKSRASSDSPPRRGRTGR